MKSKKSSRTYSTGVMGALSHPIRVALYDLIKKGVNTTPDLAKILNENRLNLYHHLEKLEREGLIESYYSQDRIKKFKAIDLKDSQKSQGKKSGPLSFIKRDSADVSDISDIKSMVVIPLETLNKEFNKKVREILSLANLNLDKSMDIVQIQVFYQQKKISEYQSTQVTKIMKKQKS